MQSELNFLVEISEDGLGIDVSILDVTFFFNGSDPEQAKDCLESCKHLSDVIDLYDDKDYAEFLDKFENAARGCLKQCFPKGPKPIHAPERRKRKKQGHSCAPRMR